MTDIERIEEQIDGALLRFPGCGHEVIADIRRDILSALRAMPLDLRLALAEELVPWEPIEKAADGEHALIYFERGERGNGGIECATFFHDEDGRITGFWTHGGPNSGSDWVTKDGEEPTHFKPLPAPPQQKDEPHG